MHMKFLAENSNKVKLSYFLQTEAFLGRLVKGERPQYMPV